METKIVRKVRQIFMDTATDIKWYEKLLNNVNNTVVSKEFYKIRESDETIHSDGTITKTTRDRISYVIDYEEEIL